MKDIQYCQCCGAKIVQYKHNLNKMLVDALDKFYHVGGEGNVSKIGLTNNQWNNFQKLKYFGLVESLDKRGHWKITKTGVDFLKGKVEIHKNAISYRGEFSHFEGDKVKIDKFIKRNYDKIDYYINEGSQGVLI